MTPSQRTVLVAFAAGAAGFVVLFALGMVWYISAALGVVLAVSAGLALDHLAPTDPQGELTRLVQDIERVAGRIRAAGRRVSDPDTVAALEAGCDGVPHMVEIIRQRDVAVAVSLAQRSLAYLTDVAGTLEDYIDVQDSGDPEFLRQGRTELQRLATFTMQPDRELSERKMDDYINSLTALNLNPPPELT